MVTGTSSRAPVAVELPRGLGCILANPGIHSLSRVSVCQPAEFWQAALRCEDVALEVNAAEALGALPSPAGLAALADALGPGWHPDTAAASAKALCKAARTRRAERTEILERLRSHMMVGSGEKSLESRGSAERRRAFITRELSGVGEFWPALLLSCERGSRDDLQTLVATAALGRASHPRAVEALRVRLRLEQALPSECQRLTIAALRSLHQQGARADLGFDEQSRSVRRCACMLAVERGDVSALETLRLALGGGEGPAELLQRAFWAAEALPESRLAAEFAALGGAPRAWPSLHAALVTHERPEAEPRPDDRREESGKRRRLSIVKVVA